VLSLMGVLSLIAFPYLTHHMQRQELEVAVRQMTTEIRLAQQKAISSGKQGSLDFYIYADHYRINLPGERKRVDLPGGISYAYINFPQKGSVFGIRELSFSRTGAPNRGGTIGLKNEKEERLYVIVTPATGRVRTSTERPD